MTTILRKADGTEKRSDEKVCSKCERPLPNEMFSKNKASADGLSYWCKECIREKNRCYKKKAYARKKAQKAGGALAPAQETIEGKIANLVSRLEALCDEINTRFQLVSSRIDAIEARLG